MSIFNRSFFGDAFHEKRVSVSYTTTTEETGPATDDLVAMLREDL